MKETLLRINAWITIIFYSIISFVTLMIIVTEKFQFSSILTFFMCLCILRTGWSARKFGLTEFNINKFSKLLAGVTLIFGFFFLFLIPILLTKIFGYGNSNSTISILMILFMPALISSLTILFLKPKKL